MESKSENKRRRQAHWKDRVCGTGKLNKTLSQAVRGSGDKLVRTVAPQSNPTSRVFSAQQMHQEISEFWNGIHDLDLEESQDHSWLDPYLDDVPSPKPITLQTITHDEVTARFAQMRLRSARGPDGWSVGELRSLPKVAHQQMAMLYASVEAWGK